MRSSAGMDNKILLGKRLRELRLCKGLSQEKLAELAKIEPTSLSNIENGRNYPSFGTLENIMKELDTDFANVFEFSQHGDPDDLIKEINDLLHENPEKLKDAYKLIKALMN